MIGPLTGRVIRVSSLDKRRRRAGFTFGPDATDIDADVLGEERALQLLSDPRLKIEVQIDDRFVVIPPEEVNPMLTAYRERADATGAPVVVSEVAQAARHEAAPMGGGQTGSGFVRGPEDVAPGDFVRNPDRLTPGVMGDDLGDGPFGMPLGPRLIDASDEALRDEAAKRNLVVLGADARAVHGFAIGDGVELDYVTGTITVAETPTPTPAPTPTPIPTTTPVTPAPSSKPLPAKAVKSPSKRNKAASKVV